MILGIILTLFIIRVLSNMYNKSIAKNTKLFAKYLYEVIKAANNS